MDALTYVMTYEPNNIKHSSVNEFRLVDHDSLKFSNGKFHWFSRGIGGKTALDFLIKVRGMDFVDAVRFLAGDENSLPIPSQPVSLPPKVIQKKKIKPFALPKANHNNDRAIAYLLGRGIDREIIERCIAEKKLYEEKKYHNCTFVGYDFEGIARFACVRSTQNNVRLDMDSSDKRFGFSLTAKKPPGDMIMIAEAPIDALSVATLMKIDNRNWESYHYLSLGGVSPLALLQYLKDHEQVRHITFCLDNDNAGIKAMGKICSAVFADENLRKRRLTITTEPPCYGKDFNDSLMVVRKQQTEYIKQSRSENRAAISI
ncbi:MAG: toprim domain-containing protein [Lachnospiraceae bacterium]